MTIQDALKLAQQIRDFPWESKEPLPSPNEAIKLIRAVWPKHTWITGEHALIALRSAAEHKLIVRSLWDADAECTCFGWAFTGTGKHTRKQILREFKRHTAQYGGSDAQLSEGMERL